MVKSLNTTVTATGTNSGFWTVMDGTSVMNTVSVPQQQGAGSGLLSKSRAAALENAVFAHIQAMRSLGHETANTAQIAGALALPLRAVDDAIAALHNRGVRLTK